MLYRLLRWAATVALRWFYRDVEVDGLDRVPRRGPLLLAVNHPNALADVLAVATTLPRRVTFTGKAVLFDSPFLRLFLPLVGFVPLRRAKDEAERAAGAPIDAKRNAEAFRAITDALARGAAVLIFPEGISHNDPSLAPLKTGAARIALEARAAGVRGLSIIPVGLTFEEKWRPRTRVYVHVGDPIAMDDWSSAANDEAAVRELTSTIDARLRAITLNFPSADEAERLLTVARTLAGMFDEPRPLGAPDPPLGEQIRILRRIEAVRDALPAHGYEANRARHFLDRIETLRVRLTRRSIIPNEIGLSPELAPGIVFAVRESAIIALLGPIAWWGRINHWIPLTLAQWLSRRMSKNPEDPAMNTLVIGFALVLVAYAAQTALVWHWFGARWAIPYLVSLPASATWDLRFRDRMRRARQRMRTWFRFRRDPELRRELCAELEWVRTEALALERELSPLSPLAPGGSDRRDPSATPRVARRSAGP